jgi:lysozyme family protein
MANFDPICEWLLRLEDSRLAGIPVNLGDGAGITRFGITSNNVPMPAGFYDGSMGTADALAAAKAHYRAKDWAIIDGDQIADDAEAATIFSFAVNGGDETEIKLVQTALGIPADGKVGPFTLSALNKPGAAGKIRDAQAQHYRNIYNSNPAKWGKFINGWLRRAALIYPATL